MQAVLGEKAMAIERLTFAVASCSWIDPATGLPEVDKQAITGPMVNRGFLVGNAGYRFANFMEIWANIDNVKKSVGKIGFSSASGIYRGPSFLGIPSHAFLVRQESVIENGAARFTQIVGARTVSPEVGGAGAGLLVGAGTGALIGSAVPVIGTAIGAIAGGLIGAFAGEAVGHQAMGFPPIWTKLQIRVHGNGDFDAEMLQHSLFPSMTVYRQKQVSRGSNIERSFEVIPQSGNSTYYNATKDVELPAWQAGGWGQLSNGSTTGPTAGNPWGISKDAMGLTSSVPN